MSAPVQAAHAKHRVHAAEAMAAGIMKPLVYAVVQDDGHGLRFAVIMTFINCLPFFYLHPAIKRLGKTGILPTACFNVGLT